MTRTYFQISADRHWLVVGRSRDPTRRKSGKFAQRFTLFAVCDGDCELEIKHRLADHRASSRRTELFRVTPALAREVLSIIDGWRVINREAVGYLKSKGEAGRGQGEAGQAPAGRWFFHGF